YDFSGDLYGKTLEVSVVERIRPVMDFASVEDLKKKMNEDDQKIKEIFRVIKSKAVPLSLAG
ncbi:MAG: hypothetical protein IID15_07860, partial [Candidatus Marinimicrobia bacterium]|nr:hypothetical protein [Candidatus Neomarinimicrobiota bacterium]